ncbi:LysR substrate-binding domain-containing protein [Robbsia betulipollinis]|uniref:LysR substrate-binding domain-containing protein n=1 Tax=Robbsia betulipollinis TaxID=2981849 RepID=UPI0032C43543
MAGTNGNVAAGQVSSVRTRLTDTISAGHPLAVVERVTLAEVVRHAFPMLDMDEHVQTASRYWTQHGLTPSIRFQSKSIEGIRSMVALGSGVTILSDLVYRSWSLEGARIVRRPLAENVPTMDVGIIWSRQRGWPAAAQALRVSCARRRVPGRRAEAPRQRA